MYLDIYRADMEHVLTGQVCAIISTIFGRKCDYIELSENENKLKKVFRKWEKTQIKK